MTQWDIVDEANRVGGSLRLALATLFVSHSYTLMANVKIYPFNVSCFVCPLIEGGGGGW